LNPLDRYKRFQITFSFSFSGFILTQEGPSFISDDLCNAAALSLVLCGTVPWWKREEQQAPTLLPDFVAARESYYRKKTEPEGAA
jgi:hypothetical protein